MTTQFNNVASGTLRVSNAPDLVLTAINLNEGTALQLRPLISPPPATQLWTVGNGRISLAANPNLVVGPGASTDKDAILFDVTKTNNSTSRDLLFSGLDGLFPYALDGSNFTNINLVTASRLALDVANKSTAAGSSVIFWTLNSTAPNQLWSFTIVPPTTPHIVFFDIENYGGASVEVSSSISDMSLKNFANKVSSIQVTSGKWLLYYGANFPAEINALWVVSSTGGPNGDGRYPNASTWGDWNAGGNRINSVRPLPNTGIVLFENPWFGGKAVEIQRDTPDLTDSGLLFAVSAIVVVSGTWRVFFDKNYSGNNNLVFPTGGFYTSGFYPQAIQWGGADNYVNSLRREK